MIIFTIVLIVAIISIYLFVKYKNNNNKDGLLITVMFTGLLSIVILCIMGIKFSFKSYNYDILVIERNSFEKDLTESRLNNNPLETAAITKDIIQWNKELERLKYQNTTILCGWGIDDRVNNLKRIK